MSDTIITIITAAITGGFTLMGVVLSNNKNKTIMEYEVKELRKKVQEHNDYAKTMPVIAEQIKTLNRRIADLEEAIKKYGR